MRPHNSGKPKTRAARAVASALLALLCTGCSAAAGSADVDALLRAPQLTGQSSAVLRSRSLWDAQLSLPDDALADGTIHRHHITGPRGEPLRAVERSLKAAEQAESCQKADSSCGQQVLTCLGGT